jgi:hypothetical protein
MKKNSPVVEELPLTENEFHQYIRSGQTDSFKSKINSAYVSTLRLTNVSSRLIVEWMDNFTDGNLLWKSGDNKLNPRVEFFCAVYHCQRQKW